MTERSRPDIQPIIAVMTTKGFRNLLNGIGRSLRDYWSISKELRSLTYTIH
jgi:hypothetical protein